MRTASARFWLSLIMPIRLLAFSGRVFGASRRQVMDFCAISFATLLSWLRRNSARRCSTGGNGSKTLRFNFNARMCLKASSNRRAGISPERTALMSAARTFFCVSPENAMKTISAPALIALTATRSTPYSEMERIPSSSSVKMRPSKPNSSRSRPVRSREDIVAGT